MPGRVTDRSSVTYVPCSLTNQNHRQEIPQVETVHELLGTPRFQKTIDFYHESILVRLLPHVLLSDLFKKKPFEWYTCYIAVFLKYK